MIDQTTMAGKVLTAAFDLAASPGWSEVSLRDIADAAGVSLADVMERFEDKSDILKVFVEHVDRAMLEAAAEVEREQTPRDAVFEVIMSRFDLMAPYKTGLKSIVADQAARLPDPGFVRLALKSQHRIMQAAGIGAAGAPALVRQLGLARVYGQVFQIWLDDDDAGMARTMAALDKRLRQGEQALRTLDDVAGSLDRVCTGANAFAARVVAGLRAAASGRPGRTEGNDEPSPPDAAPPPAGEPGPGDAPSGPSAGPSGNPSPGPGPVPV